MEDLEKAQSDIFLAYGDHDLEQARSKGKKVRSLRILIQPGWMESAFPDNADNKRILDYLTRQKGRIWHLPLGSEERVWLREIFNHNHQTAWDDFYSVIRIKLLLEKFVYRFKKEVAQEHVKPFSLFEMERLRKAEQHLLRDFSEPAPTINELAREAGMSPSKFKTDFRQVYGLPVYQYFQRNRMLQARRLLETNEMTIKEAGIRVGYTNLSHFSVAFRKEFGLLPSELQSKTRENESPNP